MQKLQVNSVQTKAGNCYCWTRTRKWKNFEDWLVCHQLLVESFLMNEILMTHNSGTNWQHCIYLSIYLFLYLSVYPSIYLWSTDHPSDHPSIHPYIISLLFHIFQILNFFNLFCYIFLAASYNIVMADGIFVQGKRTTGSSPWIIEDGSPLPYTPPTGIRNENNPSYTRLVFAVDAGFDLVAIPLSNLERFFFCEVWYFKE